jgi:SpoVK/Ycf46/Vps4 family AAA+-type ATPase
MPQRITPSPDLVHDLEVLIRAHHPLILLDTKDDARAHAIITHVASVVGLPYFVWEAHKGLREKGRGEAIPGTVLPPRVLAHIANEDTEAIYHLRALPEFLDNKSIIAQLREIHEKLFRHKGAIFFSAPEPKIPPALDHRITRVNIAPPNKDEYYQFVRALVADLRRRMHVTIALDSVEVNQLLNHLAGLTLFEVKKVLTRSIVETQRLDDQTVSAVLAAKRQIVEQSGVLEYFPTEESMHDVAGLTRLKQWLQKRKLAFAHPERAADFGLTPPKGILLLGVQGCGKSLCAKAVAREWELPLIRLDPSNIYQKYVGESEANLKRAIRTAEAMAPIVLWIDEIEKAFGGQDNDGGTSMRIFGTFLSWMQDKKADIFVIATSNDISRLPPELLRKGRFDEIFFVDLPNSDVRRTILELHLARRNWDATAFDLDKLAELTVGFSGAEIEQVIISGLYSAFSMNNELSTEILENEITETRPLSVTMSEKIEALRDWASDRAVPAD